MEISTFLNKVTDVGGKYAEKSSEILHSNEVIAFDPVLQTVVGEAKERLKKIEQEYQRTCNKYRELQSNRYKLYIEGNSSEHHIRWVGYCVNQCKDLVKQLQNVLDMMNIKEVSQQGKELSNHRKKLHGCTSLTQEKMRLKQKPECKEPNNDKLSQKTIDFKEINRKFRLIKRDIPRISRKKPVHELLSRLMETNKLGEKAIVGGRILDNPTSQDNIRTSTSIVIKLLEKLIKELEKESEKTDNTLREQRMMQKGYYTEKMKQLQRKKEWLCGKWDDERKYMLGLKNINDRVEYFLPTFQRWIH